MERTNQSEDMLLVEDHKGLSLYRFLLHLVTSTIDKNNAMLNVIETNAFKHLTHLSLKLLQPNDTALKKYLGECLIQLKVSSCKVFAIYIYTAIVLGSQRCT